MDNRSIHAGYMTPKGLVERVEEAEANELALIANALNHLGKAMAKPHEDTPYPGCKEKAE